MEGRSSTKRDALLQWIQKKIPRCNIKNFSSDWNDGKAVCCMVNSLKKDAIPERLFKDSTNAERNASIGLQMANELFGIPKLISSHDMSNPNLDESAMMTYISMFYNVENSGKPAKGLLDKPFTEKSVMMSSNRSGDLSIPCKVHGEGLYKAQINNVAEFMLELNGVNPADLVISVECKPFSGATGGYRPELSVKPIDSNQFIIKYSPKRTGFYSIGVLYRGNHLRGSPFNLSVGNNSESKSQTFSEDSLSSRECSLLSDTTDSGFESLTKDNEIKDTVNKAEGPGLLHGEVGKLGSFNVITEANNKGPLSVCITCPAVSIPVPYVKSRKHGQITAHTVKYTPTEPGNYDIYMKWGDQQIDGCPFRVTISEVTYETENVSNRDEIDIGGKGKIRLYYSRTSVDKNEQKRKNILETLLLEKGFTRSHRYDPPIAIDLLPNKNQRDDIFKKAHTRNTPFIFVDDNFIGDCDKILLLNEKGNLDKVLNWQDTSL